MPKYLVEVTITYTYEGEVEAEDESEAREIAMTDDSLWGHTWPEQMEDIRADIIQEIEDQ